MGEGLIMGGPPPFFSLLPLPFPICFKEAGKMNETLLLFDQDHPFWNKNLLSLLDKDSKEAETLLKKGLIEKTPGGNYKVTEAGRKALDNYCRECYMPANLPIYSDLDEDAAISTTRFYLLFENSFTGRWSWKDYSFRKELEYFPSLPREKMYKIDNKGLNWLYPEDPQVTVILQKYPNTGMKAREMDPPDQAEVFKWLEGKNIKRGTFTPDLLFMSRYDFEYYSDVPPDPNDRYSFLNSDRMFCFNSPEPEEKNLQLFIDRIAEVHLLMMNYRQIYLPGYTHMDTANQENLNWIVWITRTEKEAEKVVSLLGRFGKDLIEPALPLDIYTFSHEGLASVGEKSETIYDLLFNHAHAIAKPD